MHQGSDRAGCYEEGVFAIEFGSHRCMVMLGCWGPVVACNVPKRGWFSGAGQVAGPYDSSAARPSPNFVATSTYSSTISSTT